jgi:glycosyltransferase involved in cell wall biosynthesis
MKLCFIAFGHTVVDVLNGDTRKSGGSEAQTAYLAAAFATLGHQVDLIYGDGRARSAPCVIAGVRCMDAFPSWRRPGSLLTFWTALKESAADLIYARLRNDSLGLAGLFSKWHPGSTFVYALANDRDCNPWQAYDHNRWFHNPLYALGLRTADVVALQHEAQARLVKPYVKGELILVPNLMPSVACGPRKYEETDIDAIWIAKIRPQKQLHVFLDLAEELPHLQFAVVGGFAADLDRKWRRDLEHRMETLTNLRFLGPQRFEDVMQFLAHSKVLVNTSYWEGFPNTMLEAWSVGVPVVSLEIDPGSVIQREAIGLVSGTVAKMIRDVERLVQTRPLNCEMGQRGLEYVRRAHSLEAVCRAFERIMPGIQAQGDAVRKGVAP